MKYMHRGILLGFCTLLLSACGTGPQQIELENTQVTKAQFARLSLPLTEDEKATQSTLISTAEKGDILVEQHAFDGGRVSGIFYANRVVFKNAGKQETLTTIMDSPYVANFMGDGRVMGNIKNHSNDDFGSGIYAMVENTNRTKYCSVFSFTYLHPHYVKDSTIDGALCKSAAQENAITMEFYAKEFMTAMKKR